MSTQKPKDPGELSLRPSASAGGGKKADFSNVQGKADTVRGNVDTAPAGTSDDAGTYTVLKGDTLSGIAQKHYGKASRWNAIFEANRDQLDDPDLIKPGQVLKLPDIND